MKITLIKTKQNKKKKKNPFVTSILFFVLFSVVTLSTLAMLANHQLHDFVFLNALGCRLFAFGFFFFTCFLVHHNKRNTHQKQNQLNTKLKKCVVIHRKVYCRSQNQFNNRCKQAQKKATGDYDHMLSHLFC